MVTAIINLAHSMGLETIADGVETKDQVEALRDLGWRPGRAITSRARGPAKRSPSCWARATPWPCRTPSSRKSRRRRGRRQGQGGCRGRRKTCHVADPQADGEVVLRRPDDPARRGADVLLADVSVSSRAAGHFPACADRAVPDTYDAILDYLRDVAPQSAIAPIDESLRTAFRNKDTAATAVVLSVMSSSTARQACWKRRAVRSTWSSGRATDAASSIARRSTSCSRWYWECSCCRHW